MSSSGNKETEENSGSLGHPTQYRTVSRIDSPHPRETSENAL